MWTAVVIWGVSLAAGQPDAVAPAPPANPPVSATEPPRRRLTLPSLDELLGLDPEPGQPDADVPVLPVDPDQAALDRQLTQGEMSQALEEAVNLMDETATRLGDAQDVGVTTQRLQEDILARLDAVITSAEEQSSSSSSSSSSPSSQQQQQQQANQPGQQQQGGQQNSEGDPNQGENTTEGTPPGRSDGAMTAPVAPDGGVWGRLPPRVRDSLVQGSTDVFSSLYRRMTEMYYKRLAEEERR